MKTCDRAADIALEWAVLEQMQQGTKVFPKPMFIDDGDDTRPVYFYVMEWIPGRPLSDVLAQASEDIFFQIASRLTEGLTELHRRGQAFCDIKPENILVQTAPDVDVRFVDVGGVTQFGRSVRQFTPFYDRAFWNEGSRRADAAYDLAGLALCLLFATVGAPKSDLLQESPLNRRTWLKKALQKFPIPVYSKLLEDAVTGAVPSAETFQLRLERDHREFLHTPVRKQATARTKGRKGKHAVSQRSRKQRRDWTEWLMWVSVSTTVVVLLVAWVDFLGWF